MPANNQAQPGVVADPYRNYRFRIEIQGVEQGHFAECHGLAARVQPIRYREGGDPGAVRLIPGQVEYAEVSLRYGLTDSYDLWDWFQFGVDGIVDRRNVSIIVLAPDHSMDAARWNLERCWPCEWRGAPLNGLSNEVAIESVTLAYERLTRE